MPVPFSPIKAADTSQDTRPRRGFRALRFEPELEAEYRRVSLQDLEHPRLVAVLVGMAIWLAFIGIDLMRLDLLQRFPHLPPMLWQLVVIRVLVLLTLMACAWTLWRNTGSHRPLYMVSGMFFLLTVGAAASIIIYRALDVPHESYVLAVVVIAIFVPLGLSFFEALALAMLCIGAVILLGIGMLEGDARQAFMRVPFVVLITAAVSAIGAYAREYAQRGQFLLRRELEWQAMRDPLTGLFNRRVFHRQLESAIGPPPDTHGAVVLAMLDVDHFKLYNDTYGHQAGDVALQRLAGVLDHLTRRPRDSAFRTGGEELGILLYGATADEVHALCAQLLQAVHKLDIAHRASATSERLTVSAGCALLGHNEPADAFYRRADQLLYKAKSQGRNCVALGPEIGGQVLRRAAQSGGTVSPIHRVL